MNKIYCDVGEVPKGKRRGSMKECAELGQVRYYGEKKMDKKMVSVAVELKNAKKNKSVGAAKQLENLKLKWSELQGKKNKLTREIKAIDDNDDEDTIDEQVKEKKVLVKDLVRVDKDIVKVKESIINTKKILEAAVAQEKEKEKEKEKDNAKKSSVVGVKKGSATNTKKEASAAKKPPSKKKLPSTKRKVSGGGKKTSNKKASNKKPSNKKPSIRKTNAKLSGGTFFPTAPPQNNHKKETGGDYVYICD